MDKSFRIKANDNLLDAFADLNTNIEQMIWEMINNAIQAALDRDLSCLIDVNCEFDPLNGSLSELQITDQSGGIPMAKIHEALEPAFRPAGVKTLNEHGMGLNMVISFITNGGGLFELISHTNENSFKILDKPSYENEIIIHDIEPEETKGLTLKFSNLENSHALKWPNAYASDIFQFWGRTCAKYRKKNDIFNRDGKKFEINLNLKCGDKVRKRTYIPLPPVLCNPISGKDEWITSFTLEKDGTEIEYKIGAAQIDKAKYSISKVGHDYVVQQLIHPYRINGKTFGFDTIYHDVVIDFTSTEHIKFTDTLAGHNYTLYSALRGERIFLKGGSSYFTKDGVKRNSVVDVLDNEAKEIFRGKLPHPVTKEKIDFIQKYVKREAGASATTAPEKIIKYRHRQIFHSVGSDVKQEVQTRYGQIDMLLDDKVILEHKRNQSKANDVLQLFKYMLDKPLNGQLWAPSHSDESEAITEHLNKMLTQQKIELRVMTDVLTNPSLTPAEKKLL